MRLFGIDEQLAKVEHFIRNWKEYKEKGKTAILLYGSQGLGKTSTAYYIAKKFGFEILEFNMGEYREKEKAKRIYNTCKTKSLRKKKLILLDEFDGMAITPEKGKFRYPTQAMKYIYKALEETIHPIIITANDIKLIPNKVLNYCETVEYKRDQNAIKLAARALGIKTYKWIPSFRQLMRIADGSMSYSTQSLSGRVKYYFLSGIVKDVEEYDDVFSLCLMENAFRCLKGTEIYEFIELLSIADIVKKYYPIDNAKFEVDRNAIDTKIRYFEKIKELKR